MTKRTFWRGTDISMDVLDRTKRLLSQIGRLKATRIYPRIVLGPFVHTRQGTALSGGLWGEAICCPLQGLVALAAP